MSIENQVNELQLQHKHVSATICTELNELQAARDDIELAIEAQQLVQMLVQRVQNQIHRKVSSVVTRCLETVFGDDAYEFTIQFEKSRQKTEARLVFIRDGLQVDPLTASGGGVVDVAAFALRLACLVLCRPPLRRTLILDEPFRFVSSHYRPAVRQMLNMLSKEMDIQFIMVTHIPDLCLGEVVELS